MAEQNLFSDRLDGLNMVVAGFAAFADLQKYRKFIPLFYENYQKTVQMFYSSGPYFSLLLQNNICLQFLFLFFFHRAHETANEARRVNKQLKECQTQAQLFNSRERLFNMPVTSVKQISYFFMTSILFIFHL